MDILFLHNNFPGQFRNLAKKLVKESNVRVAAIGSSTASVMDGVNLVKYALDVHNAIETHPFARRFDLECRRAEQVLYGLSTLASTGFRPELIVAHPGWGEALPLRTVFPNARLLVYCEFYYGALGRDLGFDAEFPSSGVDGHVALHLKNATTLLALEDCDLGVSPTHWQRSTFPISYQAKIEVVHEGIDTDLVVPDAASVLKLPSGTRLTYDDQIVTFVVRNLEPVRGYHIFMRALPKILKQCPNAQIVIVGGDGTSYGAPPSQGHSWKSIFLDEVAIGLDMSRIHFLGRVNYPTFLKVLQISSVHAYLTYPFVLSWSFLEAMSAGCVVIGSDTPPVREVLNGKNGQLVPFFDVEQWSDRIIDVLENPAQFLGMRSAARRTIIEKFNRDRICIPQMMSVLFAQSSGAPGPSKNRVWPGKQNT